MNDGKKGNTESTLMGLPEVPGGPAVTPPQTNSTQVMDETVADPAPLDQSTAPSLPPVAEKSPVTIAPPRTKTGGVRTSETINDAPRSKSSGAVPKAPEAQARRPSRIAAKPVLDETAEVDTDPNAKKPEAMSLSDLQNPNSSTDPSIAIRTAVTAPSAKPVKTGIEWTMPKVAGIAAGVSFLFVMIWVFFPSGATKKPTQPREVAPVEEELTQLKPIAPKTKAIEKPVDAKPPKPVFALDSKRHVIDPYAAHLEDQPLDPAHKYRLKIERDDSRVGTALARLDEKAGWGVVRKMASHAALQFGGAKALRLHCEPGSRFTEGTFFPLELTDLATKKGVPMKLNPALHCWDFEVMKLMELGEGIKKRVRVPTDSTVKLGEQVPIRVAYVLEALGEKKEWRTGILNPGESVLAEGRLIRFALLDPYSADNEGTVDLEILSGDTESSGLVTPSNASGAEFVPTNK